MTRRQHPPRTCLVLAGRPDRASIPDCGEAGPRYQRPLRQFLMVQTKSPQTRSPGVVRIFFTTTPIRAVIVLACLVLAGSAEMVGYATLLPALTVVVGDGAGGGHRSPLSIAPARRVPTP